MIDPTAYWPDKPRVLVSYAYKNVLDHCIQSTSREQVELLVDSGAFTAFTKGQVIDRTEYTEWLIEHQDRVMTGVVLDVIGDHIGTARNHEWMMERLPEGYPLMPVWHSTSPLSELVRLCKAHDYVGVGGLVSMSSQIRAFMAHMVTVHRIAREHGTKLHGLGVTGEIAMFRLPWHTVDSSTWLSGARYGQLRLRDENMRVVPCQVGNKLEPHIARLIRAYGGSPEQVRVPGFGLKSGGAADPTGQYLWMFRACARAYMLAEGQMRRKHDPNARLYLAYGVSYALEQLVLGHAEGNPFQKEGNS